MVAGHLQEKNGIYYMVLSYPSANGKRKNKWISTKLPVKGNKKKAEKMLSEMNTNMYRSLARVLIDFTRLWMQLGYRSRSTAWKHLCSMQPL